MDRFLSAAERVKNLSQRPSDSQLLQLYALFKQATEGDVSGETPGMFDFRGMAKFNAWSALKGMDPGTAREKYTELAESLIQELG